MKQRALVYTVFYLLAFTIAIASGLSDGFKGAHLPPMAIGIELLTFVVGTLLLILDLLNKQIPKTFKYFRVHVFGLALNALLVVFVVYLSF